LSSSQLHRCSTCDGTWIEEAVLAEHVSTLQSSVPPRIAWSISSERRALPCAACREPMEPRVLFGAAVDRCRSHGVWFDAQELTLVLERAALANVAAPTRSAYGVTDVADAAHLAVGVAEVAGASSGVVEVVLDALGAVFSAIDF
jgi:Zn-finger nucleic acid-binding protein